SVVPDLGSVVKNRTRGRFDDLFKAFAFEFGAGNQGVQLVHIGLVVLAMVVIQGFGRNMGRQSVFGIGQSGEFKSHLTSPDYSRFIRDLVRAAEADLGAK